MLDLALKTKLTQGGPSVRVHSDQMVLVMARQEAEPCERWPKTLKVELENKTRKPKEPSCKVGIVAA